MIPALIADTGGLPRALARTPEGKASFPDYREILISASAVVVPGLVLAEVDYFLRSDRRAMRKLIAEIFDPGTARFPPALSPRALSHSAVPRTGMASSTHPADRGIHTLRRHRPWATASTRHGAVARPAGKSCAPRSRTARRILRRLRRLPGSRTRNRPCHIRECAPSECRPADSDRDADDARTGLGGGLQKVDCTGSLATVRIPVRIGSRAMKRN